MAPVVALLLLLLVSWVAQGLVPLQCSRIRYNDSWRVYGVSDHNDNSRPTARLVGYVSTQDRLELEQTLQAAGFEVVTNTNDEQEASDCCYYRWNAATGMLHLTDSNSSLDPVPPRHIPRVGGEEAVLVQNGWSFLDVDENEPLSPFDVDAANSEGLYQPLWNREQVDDNSSITWSILGFSLQTMTKDQVLQQANKLDHLSKRVLLEGATDPPGTKVTANGLSLTGSVRDLKPGVVCCAISGLPLFTTADLMPTTASSGWLSFSRPLDPSHVTHIHPKADADDRRIEVVCAKSLCHLGHYFGPSDGYCINASALNFVSTTSTSAETVSMLAPVSYRSLEAAESTPSTRLLRDALRQHPPDTETLVLGAGCFWGIEFALRRLIGVINTAVGYAGGTTPNPTYETVCQGTTGHAEVVQVEFDPNVMEPRILLDCFLALHDPTKVRAHGKHAMHTGQYRSCIMLSNPALEEVARQALDDCQSQLNRELSTQVVVMDDDTPWFWPAEERHQRHKEKRDEFAMDDLLTLTAADWIEQYGRRTESIVGSAQTLENNAIEA